LRAPARRAVRVLPVERHDARERGAVHGRHAVRALAESRRRQPARDRGAADGAPMTIDWPGGRRFAFTVFDDPDAQTLESGRPVYELLTDLGVRTTKGVWPIRGIGRPSDCGQTCAEPEYRTWVEGLQRLGFEIGYHNATSHTSPREETERGLATFKQYFGAYPGAMANHYACAEAIYWGEHRLSGAARGL